MSYIPVIDFKLCSVLTEDVSEEDLEQVGRTLIHAFSESGFAYLKNFGISSELVYGVNKVTERFFLAPNEDKKRYSRLQSNFGYVGIGCEKINPLRPGDYKEAFNVSGFSVNDHTDSTKWPDDISPDFSVITSNFMQQCKLLTMRILLAIGFGMELKDSQYFVNSHSLINQRGNSTTLRSLYYPSLPEKLEPNQIRLGEHSDYGSITLLFQDDIGGLQVESLNGDYTEASPIEGTVLINIGDLLQFWTKGKLKSTKHRVIVPEEEVKRGLIRRSLAYFVHPNDDVFVDVELEYRSTSLCSSENNLVPPSKTALDYLNEKFSKSYI